jgi:hypothetical protein
MLIHQHGQVEQVVVCDMTSQQRLHMKSVVLFEVLSKETNWS